MKWRIIAPAFGGFYRATGYLKSNSTASLSSTDICAKEKEQYGLIPHHSSLEEPYITIILFFLLCPIAYVCRSRPYPAPRA